MNRTASQATNRSNRSVTGTRWDMVRRDARRTGHPYPVKIQWQEDVRARIAAMGIGKKGLAQKIGASQSAVWDTISNPEVKSSVLVPRIHAALGWDPPPDPQSPPSLSPDAVEMARLYELLPEDVRRKLLSDAEFYLRIAVEKKR